jgi:hypothetical protein
MEPKKLSNLYIRKWKLCVLGTFVLLLITCHTPLFLISSSLSAYWGDCQTTSLIQILSSPWIYHGRNVEVKGFFRFEFENQKLYLNQDDYEYDLPNAVWVSFGRRDFRVKKDMLNSKYVIIRGKFDATYRSKSNSLVGGIRDIQEIEPLTR